MADNNDDNIIDAEFEDITPPQSQGTAVVLPGAAQSGADDQYAGTDADFTLPPRPDQDEEPLRMGPEFYTRQRAGAANNGPQPGPAASPVGGPGEKSPGEILADRAAFRNINAFETLGLDRNATPEQIEAAYQAKLADPAANKRNTQLAYEVLTEPEAKARHEAHLDGRDYADPTTKRKVKPVVLLASVGVLAAAALAALAVMAHNNSARSNSAQADLAPPKASRDFSEAALNREVVQAQNTNAITIDANGYGHHQSVRDINANKRISTNITLLPNTMAHTSKGYCYKSIVSSWNQARTPFVQDANIDPERLAAINSSRGYWTNGAVTVSKMTICLPEPLAPTSPQ